MTGRLARTARTPRTRILSSLAAILLIAGCTNYYEIPIETPIKPKLDVSAFQRVLVAGFIAAHVEGRSPEDALRDAVAAGTASTLELGAGRFDPRDGARLHPDVEVADLEAVTSER